MIKAIGYNINQSIFKHLINVSESSPSMLNINKSTMKTVRKSKYINERTLAGGSSSPTMSKLRKQRNNP